MRCPHCESADTILHRVEGGDIVMCLDCGANTIIQ